MRAKPLFFFFFCCTFILYYPARSGRFVFDFIDWYMVYEQMGWRGIFHDFNDVAFRPGLHIIGYLLHIILKLHPLGWLFVVSVLQASIASVLVAVLKHILAQAGIEQARFVAFFSGLLFVVCPYQTEVVEWGGAFFYMVAALSFILSLYYFLLYAAGGRQRDLWLYFGFFIFSVFCHEIAFTMPLLVILFVLFAKNIDGTHLGKTKFVLKTAIPIFLFVPLYFIINKLTLGVWIGHYGASVHLHMDPMAMTDKLNMYLVKFYLFAHFWKPSLYALCHKHKAIYLTWVLIVLGAAALMFHMVKNATLRYIIIFAFATLIMLAMVLNLYLPDFINIHGDRLGYFATLFAFVPLCIIISRLPKVISFIIAILFVSVSVYCLHVNINSWRQASLLAKGLDKDFPYKNANHLYILNLPDNYKGAYMYRCRAVGKFAQKQMMLTGSDFPAKEVDVLSYNLTDPTDSVSVEKVSDTTLHVTLSRWGEWFWKDTYGASSYEDSLVKVSIDEWNHGYTVDFKHKEPGDVYIYQVRDQWRKVADF